MKKVLLTVTAIASSFAYIIAQTTPDFNFETWNNVQYSTTIQDPQGWASLNILNVFTTTPLSVTKDTAAPAEGTISVKITTVKVTGAQFPNPYQAEDLDTAGLLAIGQIVALPSPGIIYGFNYSWRPTVLSFQSKYTPMPGDSAYVVALLTRWNGISRDTIASGIYSTGSTTTSYALNSLTMTYNPAFLTVSPDSQQVFISSSIYSHNGAQLGSAFYIDDLEWSGWSSVNDINGLSGNIIVYPNPATTTITFSSSVYAISTVEIADITGRSIGSYIATNNKMDVQTAGLAPGMYIYSIFNDKKAMVGRGRFEITQ